MFIMNGEQLIYLLWGGLAIALIVAAITDIKSRTISNKLNLGIALAAPVFWIVSGMNFWPDMVWQLGVAAIIFAIFAGMFAIGEPHHAEMYSDFASFSAALSVKLSGGAKALGLHAKGQYDPGSNTFRARGVAVALGRAGG